MPQVNLGPFLVGTGRPPVLVAELSGNHNGSLDRAISLIRAAKESGANAIKLQTYTADTLTMNCDGPSFRVKGGLWDGRILYDLYQEAATPWTWHAALFAEARTLDLLVFSTPFDSTAVDFLEDLQCPCYKIASFEVVDLPLIRKVARTGKPLIISTGMANLGEIEEAVGAARGAGCEQLILLHCVSSYPAPTDDCNLLTIPHLSDAFGVPAGLSDHTPGTAVATAAISLGCCLVEKHMTLARADGGPDAAFSLEPREFRALVEDCRTAYLALGRISYRLKGSESGNIMFRRSLFFVSDVEEGETITHQHVRSIRPGSGLPPKHLDEVIGRQAVQRIAKGTPVAWSLLA